MTNTLNTPIEELELCYPIEVEAYGLRDPSPTRLSPAHHRGGVGLIRKYRFLRPGEVTVIGERHSSPPTHHRIQGHARGASHQIRRENGEMVKLGSKDRSPMASGDCLILETADGGSWASSS